MHTKAKNRLKRAKRFRKQVAMQKKKRLSVFRSSRHLYAQIIDTLSGNVLASASTVSGTFLALPEAERTGNKMTIAKVIGKLIAQEAKDKNIDQIVFDRSGYPYHGQVKALAESARENGLAF